MVTAEERRERARLASLRWRRKCGIMPRKPAQRPWLTEGISRSTWYRRGNRISAKFADLKSPTVGDLSLIEPVALSDRFKFGNFPNLARAEAFVVDLQAELATCRKVPGDRRRYNRRDYCGPRGRPYLIGRAAKCLHRLAAPNHHPGISEATVSIKITAKAYEEKRVKSAVAYHEAGHAVIARVQGIEINTIDMTPCEGRKAGVVAWELVGVAREAGQSALLVAEAARKDARVSLAGSIAQSKFQKAHSGRINSDGWDNDKEQLVFALALINYLNKGGTFPLPASYAPTEQDREFIQQAARELEDETRPMVTKNWPSIEKVAQIFKRGGTFNESDVDALIF